MFASSPLVRPFVHYQTCEHHILKMNEPILLQISASDQRGKEMEKFNFEGQAVKIQGHTTSKLDLEAWRTHHSRPVWSSKLSSLHDSCNIQFFHIESFIWDSVFSIIKKINFILQKSENVI